MSDKRPKLLSRIQNCFVRQGLLNKGAYNDGVWCHQTEAAYIAFCDKQQIHTFDRQLDLNNTYLVDLIFSTTQDFDADEDEDIADVDTVDDSETKEDEGELDNDESENDESENDESEDEVETKVKVKKVKTPKLPLKKTKKKKSPIKP